MAIPAEAVTAALPLTTRYVKHQPEAFCSECDWPAGLVAAEGDSWPPRLRDLARQHAATRGHKVCVAFDQEMWIEPRQDAP